MERRLRSFFARQGYENLTDSLERLRGDKQQLDDLLDRITINVSQLWRHPDQWTRLERGLLKDLAANGRVRAWSAGCSYGAEAYTLAAVCSRGDPGRAGPDPRHRHRPAHGRARQDGRFHRRRRAQRPRRGDGAVVRANPDGLAWPSRSLRAMTQFEVGDLLKLQPPASSYELIMCRNTVIYFADQIRDELHSRLAQALRPGGVLVIGGTERVSDARSLGLAAIHPFIYRKS